MSSNNTVGDLWIGGPMRRGPMRWGTNESGGPMRWGTNEMGGAWVLIGGPMRWGTNEVGDQWDGGPMRWGTNEMGDQWCAPVWPWNLMDDIKKQQGASPIIRQALCIISKPSVNSNWNSPETLNSGKNWWYFVPRGLEIWQMTNRSHILT